MHPYQHFNNKESQVLLYAIKKENISFSHIILNSFLFPTASHLPQRIQKNIAAFKKTGFTLILLEHSIHLQLQTSFDTSHSSWFLFLGFFLFRSPYTIGMWVGGCCSTSNSIWYSCFSHLIVRGRRFHGPTLSIADRTLKRQATQDSLVFLLKT